MTLFETWLRCFSRRIRRTTHIPSCLAPLHPDEPSSLGHSIAAHVRHETDIDLINLRAFHGCLRGPRERRNLWRTRPVSHRSEKVSSTALHLSGCCLACWLVWPNRVSCPRPDLHAILVPAFQEKGLMAQSYYVVAAHKGRIFLGLPGSVEMSQTTRRRISTLGVLHLGIVLPTCVLTYSKRPR